MSGARPIDRFFHPVLLSKKLKSKPVSIDVGSAGLPERVVLFRTSKGKIAATQDRCPHRGSPLSLGELRNDELVCPYHGWRVDRDGATTHPTSGPIKKCRVPTYSVHEADGFIWMASSHLARRASFPDVSEWTHMGSYEIPIDAPLELVLDNFNEDEHFPYVHKVLGWNEEGAHDVQFSCDVRGDELSVNYRGPQRDFFGRSFFMLPKNGFFDNKWVVRFDPVRISYLVTATDCAGNPVAPLRQHVVIYFVPVQKHKTVIRVMQYSSLGNSRWRLLLKMMAPLTIMVSKWDLEHDKHLLEKIVALSPDPGPIRYGTYDEPLLQARKLLRKVYWAESTRAEVGHERSVHDPEFSL